MRAFNFCTMRPYCGANAHLIGNGQYPAFATFNQVTSMGYQVKKGAKGVKIAVGIKTTTKEGEELMRYSQRTVFDIVDTTAADDKDFMKDLAREVAQMSELGASVA